MAKPILKAELLHEQVVQACAPYAVDWAHARRVAALADELFRRTRHVHGLTRTSRPLLAAAALLHDVTRSRAKADHHLHGAETITRLPLPALGAEERAIVCEAVRLHNRGVDVWAFVRELAVQNRLVSRHVAGRIGAILRIADALDHARLQKTDLAAVLDTGAEIVLFLTGDTAGQDSVYAVEKADLWNALLQRPVHVVVGVPDPAMTRPAGRGDEPRLEAVRRIFRRQLEQLFSREYGLDCQRDLEYVHEMRVATRRLRSALRLLGKSAVDLQTRWKPEISWLADALGEVRDCDVFLDFLTQYGEQAAVGHQVFLQTLIARQRRNREDRRRELLSAVQTQRYRQIHDDLYHQVTRPVGAVDGLQLDRPRAAQPVRSLAPGELDRRLEGVLSYGRDLRKLSANRRHRLRIAAKKLRYTAELFTDVLPNGLRRLIAAMTEMQDLLGDAHDTEVWSDRIREESPAAPARDALLEHLAGRKAAALAAATKRWRAFTSPRRLRKLFD